MLPSFDEAAICERRFIKLNTFFLSLHPEFSSDLVLLRVEGYVRDVVREAAEVLRERRVGGGHVVGVADTLETVYKVTIYKIKSLIK